MMLKKKLAAVLLAVAVFSTSFTGVPITKVTADDSTAPKGSLMIVGGMLRNDNKALHEKYISLAGGADKIKVAIIGAASSKPVTNSKRFRDDLSMYGVPTSSDAEFLAGSGSFYLPALALKNDSKTLDVDESTWAANGNDEAIAAKIKECNAVWFVGGDQTYITKILKNADGTNTKCLDAIWDIYKAGGVIGGTSAGAAIMSDTMNAGGSSLGALTKGTTSVYNSMSNQESGALYQEKGIGFFKNGIVDQHFDRKARLGRLIVAAYNDKSKTRYAFGIDENTGMIATENSNIIEPIGEGGVTIVDVKDAVKDKRYANGGYDKVRISYIETHDKFDISKGEFTVDPDKDFQTIGDEYYTDKFDMYTGIFSPNPSMMQYLGHGLVDNTTTSVTSFCYDERGNGVKLTFSEDALTKGYYQNYGDTYAAREERYIALNVLFKSEPITVSIKSNAFKYKVLKSDTIVKVAKKFGVSSSDLAKVNHIKISSKLKVGRTITIPSKTMKMN